MKFKFGLRLKFIIIFIIFSIMISAAIMVYSRFSFEKTITKKYSDNAIDIAKLTASIIDGDKVTQYAADLVETDSYKNLQAQINNIKKQTGVYYLYVIYPFDDKSGIYIFDAELSEEQEKLVGGTAANLGLKVDFGNDFSSALEVMETGKPSDYFDITSTQQGQIMEKLASAYAPVFDSNGKVVAFVGVDVAITEIATFVNASSYSMAVVVVGIVFICMLVLIIIIQKSVIKPVKVLKIFAEDIAQAKFGKKIRIKGHDEVSEISSVFNRMSKSIENHMKDIQEINDAYHKFVPSKIFEVLNKNKITDVELGNQVNVGMTILMFNVVGFQDIIRTMQSVEMFQFINNVLNNILPFVMEKGGVAETFQDAGFSAFYTESCEAGLATAVSICQKINTMNQNKSLQIDRPLEIGLAITNGPVMLGIVGHDKRLSTISISEHTKVAEYLQNIAPKYFARIIITAEAAGKIARFHKVYHSRFLGFFYYSTTNHYEKLYDVFDGDDEEDIRMKLQTKETFENGVNLFCAKKFSDARLAFINVLKVFKKDNASREYLYLCNQYCQTEGNSSFDIYIEKI